MKNNTPNTETMTCPITMTESARAHIQKFLNTDGKSVTFRLAVKKSGCSGYAYLVDMAEEPQKNDLSFEENGIPLWIDKDSISFLKGTVIDLVEKASYQKQLSFNNPNVEDACGCGESFTIKIPAAS